MKIPAVNLFPNNLARSLKHSSISNVLVYISGIRGLADLIKITRTMKIAITGANGFVGAALCRYFHRNGHEILAIGNRENPGENLRRIATYINADITNVIETIDADVCIHAAALSSEADTYQNLILNNVEGTLNVVEAAKNCKFFIHISSSSVYQFKNGPVTENEANIQSELSDYGETKLLAEDIVEMDIPENQKRLILRPRAIYGIGDRILLPRLLRLVKGRFFLCPFKRNTQSSLTHIDNIGYAIGLYLEQHHAPKFQVFNITDEKPYNLRNLAIECSSALTKRKMIPLSLPLPVMRYFINQQPASDIEKNISKPFFNLTRSTVLDISRIKKELNYNPTKNFQNSCSEIAEWLDTFGSTQTYLQQLQNAPWSIKM